MAHFSVEVRALLMIYRNELKKQESLMLLSIKNDEWKNICKMALSRMPIHQSGVKKEAETPIPCIHRLNANIVFSSLA